MYLEHPASRALQGPVRCVWQHAAARVGRARVVPDACMDLLWNGAQLLVAGPDTAPVELTLAAGTQILGLRFAPGVGGSVLGVPASALCDARVPLVELWGDAAHVLTDQLHAAADVPAALAAMQRAVTGRPLGGDPLALALLDRLQPKAASNELPSVAQLAAAAGLSERQLLRRARAAFGYGPKLLGRILRFQAFRAALRARPHVSLAELALELGFADQAHLTHEVSELAGVSPGQLKREAVSDFDKTAATAMPQNVRHEDHRPRTTVAR